MAAPHRRSDWFLVPNLLTLSRFFAAAAIPFVCAALEPRLGEPIALALFIYASLTDFLDGWLARRLNQTSALGAILDPLADKALLIATMAALAMGEFASQPLFWIGAALIAFREIGVTILRWRLSQSPKLAVTRAAKWKTATQMMAVSALLAVGVVERALGADASVVLWTGGLALFVVAVWLTLTTGWAYWRAARAA